MPVRFASLKDPVCIDPAFCDRSFKHIRLESVVTCDRQGLENVSVSQEPDRLGSLFWFHGCSDFDSFVPQNNLCTFYDANKRTHDFDDKFE